MLRSAVNGSVVIPFPARHPRRASAATRPATRLAIRAGRTRLSITLPRQRRAPINAMRPIRDPQAALHQILGMVSG